MPGRDRPMRRQRQPARDVSQDCSPNQSSSHDFAIDTAWMVIYTGVPAALAGLGIGGGLVAAAARAGSPGGHDPGAAVPVRPGLASAPSRGRWHGHDRLGPVIPGTGSTVHLLGIRRRVLAILPAG